MQKAETNRRFSRKETLLSRPTRPIRRKGPLPARELFSLRLPVCPAGSRICEGSFSPSRAISPELLLVIDAAILFQHVSLEGASDCQQRDRVIQLQILRVASQWLSRTQFASIRFAVQFQFAVRSSAGRTLAAIPKSIIQTSPGLAPR